MVEGTPLLRVQTGNRLEGSNPFVSATFPRESVLSIRLRPEFLVVFGGYAGEAVNRHTTQQARKRSPRADILQTCCLRSFGEQVSNICLSRQLFRRQSDLDGGRFRG